MKIKNILQKAKSLPMTMVLFTTKNTKFIYTKKILQALEKILMK